MKIEYYIAIAGMMAVLQACQKDQSLPGQEPESPLLARVIAPGISTLEEGNDRLETRAASYDPKLVPSDVPHLANGQNYTNLPKGATLWLLIEEPDQDGYVYNESNPVPPTAWKESEEYPLKPYVVGDNGNIHPCATETEGTGEDEITKIKLDGQGVISQSAPLMLPYDRLFRFHIVSPAVPLKKDRSVQISNGQYVMATDCRWNETYPRAEKISSTTGLHQLQLASIINQTARLCITVIPGDNVSKLQVQDSGIEVSGIQEESQDFKWTKDSYIKEMVGNKRNSILMEKDYVTNADGSITNYVSLLPTDASTNTIFVLFHLMVNDVPTQYMASLPSRVYKASTQYNYRFKVNVKDNVTVGQWDYVTMVEEVEMNEQP